jgi:hypothetical protein
MAIVFVSHKMINDEQFKILMARKRGGVFKQSFLTRHYVLLLAILTIVFTAITITPVIMVNQDLELVATINDDLKIYINEKENEYYTIEGSYFNPVVVHSRHLDKDITEKFLKEHFEYQEKLENFIEQKGE